MNKKTVKITGYASSMINNILGNENSDLIKDILLRKQLERILRNAKKIGDVEIINHTMLGKLQDSGIQFEFIKNN